MSLAFRRNAAAPFAQSHPVVRLIAAAALFVPPFFRESVEYQVGYVLLMFLAVLATGALGNLWRLKGIALSIFFVSLALWSLTLPGETLLWRLGPLEVHREALLIGLSRAVRLLSFLMIGVTFLTLTSIEEFTYGLHRLGLPYRACFSVTLSFRLAPLFLEAALQIANAQRTRGLDLDEGNFLARWRRYLPLMMPVVVSGFRRADQLAVALEAKGFSLPGRRVFPAVYSFTWREALLLCGVFLLNIGAYFFADIRLAV
ncbi:MAG: energy-coupling factor transporter transmembrane protein EcfT [Myxococcales bacterium]|nr:energy-coupling factor transporter transmembrane protein EcfT [Myxococcales bacterium]